ncbi:MAG TPA: 3-hydroxyacyl-ACP dehydratase FabZ [Terriglobales bacterium]|nr:3-hydroxyacyl-ACP dehydratase FabZ [Terriglobales bacterium]
MSETTDATAPPRAAHALPLDINAIERLLPHRYPFLLVDRVATHQPRRRITAIKNVTANEPFFAGHFPGHPIMPGVLVLEALAQAGALMIMLEVEDPARHLIFFTGIDQARFRRPVVPGDQLRLEVEVLAWRSSHGRMSGRAYVEDRLAAEAVLSCHVVQRPEKE